MDKHTRKTLAAGHASSVALRVIDGGLATPRETQPGAQSGAQNDARPDEHAAARSVKRSAGEAGARPEPAVPADTGGSAGQTDCGVTAAPNHQPAGMDLPADRSAAVSVRSGGRCSQISRAIDAVNSLASAVADLHRAVRNRRPPDLRHARRALDVLIDDFSADPDPVFWALAANRKLYHLCRRAVGCAVAAHAIARRLGFDREATHELMLGALLLDIGKLRVPVVILVKAGGLTDTEHRFARRHVHEGVALLESVDGLSADVIEMVRSHHERLDGSGYPCRLQGDEISLYARIAAIIDCFDALSVRRYYAEGVAGNVALGELRARAGSAFDAELVAAFCEAVGEYPTGTWVEFGDGCTGVVCAQNPEEGDARVALIADPEQQPFLEVRWLSLNRRSDIRILPPDERPAHAGAMERSLQSAIYAFRPRPD